MTNCLPYFHTVFSLENGIQVISHSFVKYYFFVWFCSIPKTPPTKLAVKYAVDKPASFFTSTQAVIALHPDKCESLLTRSAVTITTGGA